MWLNHVRSFLLIFLVGHNNSSRKKVISTILFAKIMIIRQISLVYQALKTKPSFRYYYYFVYNIDFVANCFRTVTTKWLRCLGLDPVELIEEERRQLTRNIEGEHNKKKLRERARERKNRSKAIWIWALVMQKRNFRWTVVCSRIIDTNLMYKIFYYQQNTNWWLINVKPLTNDDENSIYCLLIRSVICLLPFWPCHLTRSRIFNREKFSKCTFIWCI